MEAAEEVILQKLNLSQNFKDYLTFDKAKFNIKNNRLSFFLTAKIFFPPQKIIEFINDVKNLEIDNQKYNFKDFFIVQPKHNFDNLDFYSLIYIFLKKYKNNEINFGEFYTKKEDDIFYIIVYNQKQYVFFQKIFSNLSLILKQYGFIKGNNLQIIQNDSFFVKKKQMIEKTKKIIANEKYNHKSISYNELPKSKHLLKGDENKEIQNAYFEGEIFKISTIITKSGYNFVSYFLKDIEENYFIEIKDQSFRKNYKAYNEGDYIRIFGSWKKNKYNNGYYLGDITNVFLFNKNDVVINKEREKKNNIFIETRADLHLHTKMSVMDAITSVKEYFAEAKKLNIKSLGFTDHNSVQSFPDINAIQNKYQDIKAIYGVEFDNYYRKIEQNIVINIRNEKLLSAKYIFFDLETTGLSASYDEIIEFGAVKVYEGRIIDKKQIFIKPSKSIGEEIIEITKITNEMVKNCLTIEKVLPEIKEWIGDSVLVAHNATFDFNFLNFNYKKCNLGRLENPVIDTLKLSWLLNPDLKSHRLGNLAKNENVIYNDEVAHRADYDANILKDVFENLLHKLFTFGIKDLSQLNDFHFRIKDNYFTKHLTVLAKNNSGIKELYKLVSDAHTIYFNKRKKMPVIELETILSNRDNLLIGSGCENSYLWDAINNSTDYIEEIVKQYDYLEFFPPSAYLHLLRSNKYSLDKIKETILKIISLGKKYNIPVIVNSNAHYLKKEYKKMRDVYILNKGLGGKRHSLYDWSNPTNSLNPEHHLRDLSDLKNELSFLTESDFLNVVYYNSQKIIEKIDFVSPIKDELYTPKILGADKKFIKIIEDNFVKKYGKHPHQILVDRYNKELNALKKYGYIIIYYLSYLAVNKSLEDGYVVGSRGSVGSSFIAYLADITEVNPMKPHYVCKECQHHEFDDNVSSGFDLEDKKCPKCSGVMKGNGHDIPFETFLGFSGDKVPDIDLNFSREHQSKIHDYIKDFLGEEKVFRAGTISTVAEKTAFGYIKNYLEIINQEDSFNESKMYYYVKKIEGVKRTTGQHPGGLIVVPNDKDIYDFTPTNYPGNDIESNWKTTHFDFHSIHNNLLKLDFLGHLDPSTINMLEKLTKVSPFDIPMNDKKVLSIFQNCKALDYKKNYTNDKLGIIGIPEFGTSFVRELVKDAKPQSFSDLIRISGLSHGTNVWTGNAKTLIEKGTAKLNDVISVRDDIMTFLISKNLDPLLSFQIMESVRKGKGLKKEWEKTMSEHNVSQWYIDSCNKIQYMFPKAHATAYVIMAYRIAWYKINFPLEYYATFFTKRDIEWDLESLYKKVEGIKQFRENFNKEKKSNQTERDRVINETYEIVLEMFSRGIDIEDISLEKSHYHEWRIDYEKNALIPPFSIVNGLGEIQAKKIYEAKLEKPFRTISDFKNRSKLNKTLFEYFKNLNILKNLEKDVEEIKQISLFDYFNI